MAARNRSRRPAAPRFDPAELRTLAGEAVFARGEAYHRDGRVTLLSDDGTRIAARVDGTEAYRTALEGSGSDVAGDCSCPAFTDHGFCKHLVATGLAANAAAAAGEAVPDRLGTVRTWLVSQGAERLATMILDLAERDPALLDRLDLAAGAASGKPAEVARRCREALRRALRTGRGGFVDYAEAGGWTQGVLDVLDTLEGLIGAGQAGVVLDLVRDLIRRLPDALAHVDDSDGGGSEIAARAAALHLAACASVRPDPVALAEELFRLETEEEDLGSFDGAVDTYAELLGPTGLAAYRRLAEAEWDRLPPVRQLPPRGIVSLGHDDLARWRLFPILDRLAARDGDLDRRIALREARLAHAHDHLRLAEFCLEHGREAEAIRRAEEGAWLFDDATSEGLLLFLAARHRAAGRAAEAEAVLWPGFERAPSLCLYEALAAGTKAGSAARAALADRAVALLSDRPGAARPRGAPGVPGHLAGLLIEILRREGRLEEAWAAVGRHGCTDDTLNALAESSEAAMPEAALAAYEGMVERQVALTARPGYEAACRLVARMAALRGGEASRAAHQAYVGALLARHRAKRSFVAMLQGSPPGAAARRRS